MNLIFLGTPKFAIPALKALYESKHSIAAVITQPNREKDRKGNLLETPVKAFARKFGIPVFQFEKISEHIDELKTIDADIMITCAYGQILSQNVLDLKKYGVINIHASLLPKYRGAAPVQWALINGEQQTGITIMQTAKGLDCGDIIYKIETDIKNDENSNELFERLSSLGAEAIITSLDMIVQGKSKKTPQNNNEATYFPMLKKQDGLLDFNKNSVTLYNQIRGMYSWPCAFTYLFGQLFKVWKSEIIDKDTKNKNAAKVLSADKNGITVACKTGSINFLEVQLAGSKRMTVEEFLKGKKVPVGTVLGKIDGTC